MEMMNADRPPLDEILAMDFEDMVDVLGRETVSSRPRCATLALGTLKAAVKRYQRNKLRAEHGLEAETSSYQAEPEDFEL
jgi:nitrogen fixation NifU-like protein